MANFPTRPALSQGESPSLYKVKWEENVEAADTDGGYEFRRRRFTRSPRRSYETGFIALPHSDYQIVKAFWKAHQHDVAFTWLDQIEGENVQVRFDGFEPDYVGIGTNRMWTIKIKMSEV